jgi:hypothetical protein
MEVDKDKVIALVSSYLSRHLHLNDTCGQVSKEYATFNSTLIRHSMEKLLVVDLLNRFVSGATSSSTTKQQIPLDKANYILSKMGTSEKDDLLALINEVVLYSRLWNYIY